MTDLRRSVLLLSIVVLAACNRDEGTTVDSAQGELDMPRRKAPPYQPGPVTGAGSITGTVSGATAPAAPTTGPCAGKAPARAPVVVYLEDISRGLETPAGTPRRYELAVAECVVEPSVSIASAGATLNLSNALNAVHQVSFVYEGMRNPMVRMPFSDPGQVVPSETVLDVPGLVEVQSDLAPSVKARIVVVEHPYAVETANGSFTLEAVPPGTYTLVAVGLNGRTQSRVEVRPGAATSVTLQLQ